jgi:hypothetical protein
MRARQRVALVGFKGSPAAPQRVGFVDHVTRLRQGSSAAVVDVDPREPAELEAFFEGVFERPGAVVRVVPCRHETGRAALNCPGPS